MTIWGFPASSSNNGDRFAKGSPGNAVRLPGLRRHQPAQGRTRREPPNHPMINNPTVCTGEPLPVTISAVTYQDPGNATDRE